MSDFYSKFARVVNSAQSKSIVLEGHIYDLFYDEKTDKYVPLLDFLKTKTEINKIIRIFYELNGPIKILDNREELIQAWIDYRGGENKREEFEKNIEDSIGNATLALEFLRQLTICSREHLKAGNLLIFIEGLDLLVPQGNVNSLQEHQIRRMSIIYDWFSDLNFCNGKDTVCLVLESLSSLNTRICNMPQLLTVEISPPDKDAREHFIKWCLNQESATILKRDKDVSWNIKELASLTAGLSFFALRQMLLDALWNGKTLSQDTLVNKIEKYIQSQVGEDVIEFKKPTHTLSDVIGYPILKNFLIEYFIPRIRGNNSISGAAIAGPIGSGKTFIFEAVAAYIDVPVLVLKNIRSQWYGQTDVIFERLRRVLLSLEKAIIFVDEADTQFGSLGSEEHSTEKRLTGKIQAMMSDVALRGKIVWLLMTARIHKLSPDIRRPGRVGDLIIPILDPEGEDVESFCRWVLPESFTEKGIEEISKLFINYSSAQFASLRTEIKATKAESYDEVTNLIHDILPSDIGKTRRYQTLQALINCTRLSLIPRSYLKDINILDKEAINKKREEWKKEIRKLEYEGID